RRKMRRVSRARAPGTRANGSKRRSWGCSMAGFSLRRERVVSFRDEPLPPCWIATQDVQPPSLPALVGSGIWQTEASGGLLAHVVRSLRSAREMACVASFLLADPDIIQALLEASDRGVRVYLLTASEKLLLRE